MPDRPNIKPHDWITVDQTILAVVVRVIERGEIWSDCEVVYDPKNPTNRDVRWTGTHWQFVSSSPESYAEKRSRLAPFVATLKRAKGSSS